jgi:hypothetical protein
MAVVLGGRDEVGGGCHDQALVDFFHIITTRKYVGLSSIEVGGRGQREVARSLQQLRLSRLVAAALLVNAPPVGIGSDRWRGRRYETYMI